MDSGTFVPLALVLGAIGAITGVLGLWGWIFSRRSGSGNSRAGESGVDPAAWHKLQQELERLGTEVTGLHQELETATAVAIQRIDVDYGLLPGQTTPNSALVAMRDAAGRNGVVLNVYGNPQFRVLILRNGVLQSPDGQVLDMEGRFLQKLLGKKQ